MKIIYKLWFNANTQKKSKLYEGFSISVELNRVDAFHLNFYEVDTWHTVTKSSSGFVKLMTTEVNAMNKDLSKNEQPLLVADFKPVYAMKRSAEWTCIMDTNRPTPFLVFVNWNDVSLHVKYTMCKNTNHKARRCHQFYYIDDWDQLGFENKPKPKLAA